MLGFFVPHLRAASRERGAACGFFPHTIAPVVGRSQSKEIRPMIALNMKSDACWQSSFLDILPEIERRLHVVFRRLSPEAREEAIQEAVVHCLLSYARLHERGRADSVTPSNLAWYAALQVK